MSTASRYCVIERRTSYDISCREDMKVWNYRMGVFGRAGLLLLSVSEK
jgi:hypothetical protein